MGPRGSRPEDGGDGMTVRTQGHSLPFHSSGCTWAGKEVGGGQQVLVWCEAGQCWMQSWLSGRHSVCFFSANTVLSLVAWSLGTIFSLPLWAPARLTAGELEANFIQPLALSELRMKTVEAPGTHPGIFCGLNMCTHILAHTHVPHLKCSILAPAYNP